MNGDVLWDEKNSFVPGIDYLFTEADKVVVEITEEDEEDTNFNILYRISVRVALFRLAIAGYTRKSVQKVYSNWREYKEEGSEYYSNDLIEDKFYESTDYDAYLKKISEFLSDSFDYKKMSEFLK
jgi:hypothetical protein